MKKKQLAFQKIKLARRGKLDDPVSAIEAKTTVMKRILQPML